MIGWLIQVPNAAPGLIDRLKPLHRRDQLWRISGIQPLDCLESAEIHGARISHTDKHTQIRKWLLRLGVETGDVGFYKLLILSNLEVRGLEPLAFSLRTRLPFFTRPRQLGTYSYIYHHLLYHVRPDKPCGNK